ncbi:MAG: signal recognition particle-docking protein FtsY [Gammaproteobacteria bacterium]|nr:signal recognition particle-docking protein FtsY [Gammaproteobacteria bacterium]
MLKFLSRNKKEQTEVSTAASEEQPLGFFKKLTQGLTRTRQGLVSKVGNLILGKKVIDESLLEEIEEALLSADIGVAVTKGIIADLSSQLKRNQLQDGEALWAALQAHLQALLLPVTQPLQVASLDEPYVILMVGINGAGKTTTIGKLAKYLQKDHKKIMLAAGDTFRAAAVEQLQVWGERNDIAVIANTQGDSPAVMYDAMQAAKARHMDVLIADTAGRLHTQRNLMEELKKVKRVISKFSPTAPHEVLLVLDASIGQNALIQAIQFKEAVGVTGLVITKLDGTAKGGIVFAIAKELQLPIRFIGVGEGIEDLKPFNGEDFVSALFANDEESDE